MGPSLAVTCGHVSSRFNKDKWGSWAIMGWCELFKSAEVPQTRDLYCLWKLQFCMVWGSPSFWWPRKVTATRSSPHATDLQLELLSTPALFTRTLHLFLLATSAKFFRLSASSLTTAATASGALVKELQSKGTYLLYTGHVNKFSEFWISFTYQCHSPKDGFTGKITLSRCFFSHG